MTPQEITRAMRTFAFDPKLMFKALVQSVKASGVQSPDVVPQELKCSDARIVCAVSESARASPCALAQAQELQEAVGIEHVKHMDTRCPVYVNATSISGMHVCSQIHACLHCAVARCAGHTTGPVHERQRRGMLLLLRVVRCLSEALAYFTVHSEVAMETATRVMHDFMHRRRVSRHDIVNDFYAVVRTHRIEFLASLEHPNPNTASLTLSRKSFDDIVLRWSDHGLCE
jgi:FAD/FMN-containing dehydrogenase